MKLNFRVCILFLLAIFALFSDGCGCGNNRHYIKARELYRDKNFTDAIEELKIAHKQEPKNTEIISFFGKVYFENKNYDEAIEMYEKELKIVPNDIQAHLSLAKTYKEKGNQPDAIEHLKKVIDINPNGKLAREAEKLIPECENAKNTAGAQQPNKTNAGAAAAKQNKGQSGEPKKAAPGGRTAKMDF